MLEHNQKEQTEEISKLRKQLSQAVDLLEAEKAKKRLTKNLDFVQVERSELRCIAELGQKSSLALDILMMLVQSMNKENAVMMSYETMAALTGKKDRTLRRAIKILKEGKWIQVIKIGTANAYVVNNAVFWTDRGDKKYTSFSAQIITTFDEQDKDVRSNPNIKLKRVPSVESEKDKISELI